MGKKIFVEDIHCENCVRRIKEALDKISVSCEISLEEKTVTVNGCDVCYKKAFEEIYDIGFTPREDK